MSIAIITQPQQPQPAANKSIYVVSGSNQASGNFRYVADVKDGSLNLLARLKCDKLPDGNGFFNVANVIQTLIVPAKPNPVAGWQDAKIAEEYNIEFTDEFGTPPVVSTGTTNASGIVWKAYFPQQAIPVTSGYMGTFANPQALLPLTNRPTSYKSRSNQDDFLTVMKFINAPFEIEIIYPTRTFIISDSATSGFLSASVNIGSAGLQALTSGQTADNLPGIIGLPKTKAQAYTYYNTRATAGGAVSEINPCAQNAYNQLLPDYPLGQSYQVQILDFNGDPTTTYTITIEDCERYPSQIVYFRNALGGVDSYLFKMKNRKRIEAERTTYNRNSDIYGTTSFDKIWQTEYTERLELNSDWLTDAEFRWLQEMFLTSELWVLQNGNLVEAVVTSNSYNVATRAVDRLQQLNIAIDIAFKNTTL